MDPRDITKIREQQEKDKKAEAKNEGKEGAERPQPPTEPPDPVPPENNLGTYPMPKVDPLADNPAQVTSVTAGGPGQAHGLPRPMTEKDLEDSTKPEPHGKKGAAKKEDKPAKEK